MVFLIYLIIPCLIAVISYWFTERITLKELLIQLVAQLAIIGIMTTCIINSDDSDIEIWNGKVTSKTKDRVSCEHSYSCNCVDICSSDSEGNTSCHEICQTCYDHDYDIDWNIHNNIGETFNINRVDRQGLDEPSRWTSVVIGEPTSSHHSYDNYIKGNPDTLFKKTGLIDKYKKWLPEYPSDIKDYYKLNRVITVSNKGLVGVVDNSWWVALSELNGELGKDKQVNIVLVITTDFDQEYSLALEEYWLYGKKNDAIVVVNIDKDNNITWANVISISDEYFKISLRNAILDLKILGRDTLLDTIKNQTKANFKRRSMKDFEYLKSSIQPTFNQWFWGMLFSVLVSIGLSIFFYKSEETD